MKFRKGIKQSSTFFRMLPIKTFWELVGISIAITTCCNLRCTMCERTANLDRLKLLNIEEKVFRKVVKGLENKEITLCGLGETLMHPNIFNLIDIAKEHGNRVDFTSNANLMNAKIANEIIKHDVDSIFFSIDGVGENYNKIRNGGDFRTVINNIRKLKELKIRYKKDKPLMKVSFVGMKSNIEDFPKLIGILSPYISEFGLLHPVIFDKSMMNEHLNKNITLAKRIIRKAEKIANLNRVGITVKPFVPTPRGCLEPWIKPYIGMDGTVYPCSMIGSNFGLDIVNEYYDDVKVSFKLEDYAFGNIMDDELNNIWNNEKAVEFRKKLKKIIVNDIGKKWTEKSYIDMVREKGDSIEFCEFCPNRWNCGA